MDWLTEYFDVLLPVALVLLFLFQRLFVRDEEEHGPLPSEDETEEEARRIQEEIRRKIIARQQGRVEEPEPIISYEEPLQRPSTFPRREEVQPPPLAGGRARPIEPPPRARQAEPKPSGRDIQAELRIQRERLREAQEAKEEAMRRTSSRRSSRTRRVTAVRPFEGGDLRSQLLADLSTGDSMKKAFLLKEIVDRPVGLRDRPDVFSNWG